MRKTLYVIIIIFSLFFGVQTLHAERSAEYEYAYHKINQYVQHSLIDTTNKQRLLERVREKGSIKVWVFYQMDYTPEGDLNGIEIMEQREYIKNMHSRFIEELEEKELQIRSVNKMNREPRVAMFVDEEALEYILNSPLVEDVTLVQRYRTQLIESTSIVRATETRNLEFTGEGEVIVILDTGVDPNHEMIDGKVVDGACFSTDNFVENISTLCPNDSNQDFGILAGGNCTGISGCDHGTHVAGIAVGNSPNIKGVASKADIISIQVFSEIDDEEKCPDIDDDGVGDPPCIEAFEDDIQSALDYVYHQFYNNQNYNIAAVNMSLGGGEFASECDTHLLQQSINSLVGAGISVIAASGNEGYTNAMSSPACIPEVISVGATDNQDEHWEDSNAASFLDLVAPGVGITSSIPGGSSTAIFNGTSQATPHVAGTIAVMRNATPTLSQPQIRQILRNSAYWESSMNPTWPYDQPSNQYGYGRLDSYEALMSALSLNPNVLLPDHNIIYEDETFEGKDIYILEDHTLHIQGKVTLDKNQTLNERPSNLNIAGILEGPSSASLNLIDESRFNILASGLNYFEGEINIIIKDELTYAEDTTLENGFNLAIESGGSLNLVDGATFSTKPGVKFTMETNTQIASITTTSNQNIQYQSASNTENVPPNEFVISSEYENNDTPSEFGLENNYPNPFNPATIISYELPAASDVTLEVFDMLGRRVAVLVDEAVSAGRHEVHFDAGSLSSGVYIYRIRANQFVQTRQMVLVK